MFISNQEQGPLEDEAVQTLRDILGTDEYNDGTPSSVTYSYFLWNLKQHLFL